MPPPHPIQLQLAGLQAASMSQIMPPPPRPRPRPRPQIQLQLAPLRFTKIPPTSCMYNGRWYWNQTWFNLSSSIKILLIVLLQKSKLSHADALNFLLLDSHERLNWVHLCDEYDEIAAHAKEKRIKKLMKNGRKTFDYRDMLEMEEEEVDGPVFSVSQDEVHEGKRFLLTRCNREAGWPIRDAVAKRLDDWAGWEFLYPLLPSRS